MSNELSEYIFNISVLSLLNIVVYYLYDGRLKLIVFKLDEEKTVNKLGLLQTLDI